VEEIAGKNLDNFFNNYVNDTKQIDYNKFLGYAGLQIIDQNIDSNDKNLGALVYTKEGKLIIRRVINGTPAYNSGLNVDDEIIAVNNYRVDKNLFDNIIKNSTADSVLDFLISRDGKLMNIKVKLEVNTVKKFNIVDLDIVSDKQRMVYNKWLRIK